MSSQMCSVAEGSSMESLGSLTLSCVMCVNESTIIGFFWLGKRGHDALHFSRQVSEEAASCSLIVEEFLSNINTQALNYLFSHSRQP